MVHVISFVVPICGPYFFLIISARFTYCKIVEHECLTLVRSLCNVCSSARELINLKKENTMQTTSNYSHLLNDCQADYCKSCAEPIKQSQQGSWYITMGHPGYNSPANNRSGYVSKAKAVQAYLRYKAK